MVPVTPPDTDTATYNGFEIVFTPAVNGWQVRAPDDTLSRESYRSAFLARKAIDTLASAGVAEAPARKRRRVAARAGRSALPDQRKGTPEVSEVR